MDWDDSRVLDGEVGDYVTIVRKDRHSRDWYLGSITDEHGRVLPVALSFLEPGVRYRAEIYRDGDAADYRSNPFAFVREQREVTSADRLQLKLAPGGGQAIRFVPLGRRGGRPRQYADAPLMFKAPVARRRVPPLAGAPVSGDALLPAHAAHIAACASAPLESIPMR